MTTPEGNLLSSSEQVGEPVTETPVSAAQEQSPQAPESSEANAAPRDEKPHRDGETILQSLLSIIVIVLFVITFVVQAFQIPSQSMEKTLLVGDYLLVDKIHFGQGNAFDWLLPYREINRGDIVVFHYPVDPTQHFVKRVIGIPGDHILLRNKTVFVNDMAVPEEYAVHLAGNRDGYRDNFPSETDYTGQVNPRWRSIMPVNVKDGELVVPPNQYFVMGDNRDDSLDSRYWGFVPRANVVGRPLVIYLSVRERPDETSSGNGKLIPSGHVLAHIWQFARWDRMFRLVR